MPASAPEKCVLDTLLASSAEWLVEIQNHNVDILEERIGHDQNVLMAFMQASDILTMSRHQQQQLAQLLSQHQDAIKLVSSYKQVLAGKIHELRKGRNLKHTYQSTRSGI